MSTHLSQDPTTATIKKYPIPEAKYEEVTENGEIFIEKLEAFHRSFGTKLKVPTIAGKALDLHRLFVEVTSRGGIEKVITDRNWKEVVMAFNFPSTITSASFVLRKSYLSLLFHFEQVYFFRKQVPSVSMDDPISRTPVNSSAGRRVLEDGLAMTQLPVNQNIEPGVSVTGTIDAKFDSGYLISVNLGSEVLKGVLYHTPQALHTSPSSNANSAAPPHLKRKRYEQALRDPSRPKAHRSGYNFFFAEQYNRLKPLYHGQEKSITKRIGLLWTRLTEAEKQVYQEKGLRDKERYKTQMSEYRSSTNTGAL